MQTPVRACTCTFCAKHGGVWTSCPGGSLTVTFIDGRLFAVVNVNTFEGIDASLLRRAPVAFDDETEQARLARRKHNWIGNVRFA